MILGKFQNTNSVLSIRYKTIAKYIYLFSLDINSPDPDNSITTFTQTTDIEYFNCPDPAPITEKCGQ